MRSMNRRPARWSMAEPMAEPSAKPLVQPLARSLRLAAACALIGIASPTWAGPVYRCPAPVPVYTDQISPQQAKERGCQAIEGAPVTVVTNVKPRPVAGTRAPVTPVAASGESAARPADSRVSDREQRERDRDARRILEEELRQEQEKLAVLKKEFNNGEPERQGGERNYQRYLDRVEDMRKAIQRKEADVAAIQRELGKIVEGEQRPR